MVEEGSLHSLGARYMLYLSFHMEQAVKKHGVFPESERIGQD